MAYSHSFFSFLLILVFFLPSIVSAATIEGNVSVIPENEAPVWSAIPNVTWEEDTTYELGLSLYSSDRENYTLVYTSTTPEHIRVNILGSTARLIPDADFFGTQTVIFYAFDYVTQVSSNVVTLTVTDVSESVAPGAAAPQEGKRKIHDIDEVLAWGIEGSVRYTDVDDGTQFIFQFIDERGIETHYFFEVEEIHTEEHFVVLLFVDGRRVTVYLGERVEVDLDNNGVNDFSATLHSIARNNADISFEKVSVWRAAPALPLCEQNLYFVDDLLLEQWNREITLSGLSYCHTLFFGIAEEYDKKLLASLFVKDFDTESEQTSVLFTDIYGSYSLLILPRNVVFPLDIDADSIADYTVLFEDFDDERHITLHVTKEMPFSIFIPSKELFWTPVFIALLVSLIALGFVVYLYFNK